MICATNLHRIGQAIIDYQNNNQGISPDSLELLTLEQHVDPNWLVCPKSKETPAEGATQTELASSLKVPGHISYLYLGKGMKNDGPADAVVAYEPLANHDGMGMHVLFAAGNVEWVDASGAATLLSKVSATSRPVIYP